jgi:hypothetical protein
MLNSQELANVRSQNISGAEVILTAVKQDDF